MCGAQGAARGWDSPKNNKSGQSVVIKQETKVSKPQIGLVAQSVIIQPAYARCVTKPKTHQATGGQYLIEQVERDIIIKAHSLPLFYILVPPRQYAWSIVDLTGFQKTFKVACVQIVSANKLMLNPFRVGVGIVGPVGSEVFQIT